MKGTSEVIMGATLIMVATLAVVLGLILVLLAELYCSLLLRRRQLRNNSSNAIPTTQTTTTRANASSPSHTSHPQELSLSPFSSIYAQGVLQAPSGILLPAVSYKEDIAGSKKQLVQIRTQESKASPCQVGVLSASSPPLASKAFSKLIHQDQDPLCIVGEEHLVYISNPIYENDESQSSGANTPFETPHTSPSRLERSGSSGDDDAFLCGTHSPPLTPMKKLPAQASSVLGSDSRSNNCLFSSSSSSPPTSPS